ncbi:MAG: hypothetical protein ABI874_13735 [Chloroflexota bacterium]
MTPMIDEKQMVATLTVDDLRRLIAETVRQVVREETQGAYHVNSDGYKVLYEAEAVDPDYARELNEDYQAIASGQAAMASSGDVERELQAMGVPL